MAADLIRVRLNFDYAPPAAFGCRMCLLLVDRGSCRVVADLESIIRERFELSRGSILSLFIDDCYLPHTESVLVVRDNDCVRVKVEMASKSIMLTLPRAANENSRKRQRPVEDDASVEGGLALEFKKKKRKKSVVEIPTVNGLQATEDIQEDMPEVNTKVKKKAAKEKPKSPPAPFKPSPSIKKPPQSTEKVVKGTQKPPSSSSSSSSSSEEEQPVKKTSAPKLATKPALASARATTNGRPPSKKLPPPTSSSSSDTDSSSEEDEQKSVKAKSTNDKSKSEETQTTTVVEASNGADDADEEEIELVIRKPVQHPRGRIVVGQPGWQQESGRERGKGKKAPREPWSKGRGRGICVQYDDNQERQWHTKEPSYSTDRLTNVSLVLQNGVESVSKPDYSSMPLLAAPPQVGQKIAFKLLELTESYTPEVSDYKEANILSFDPTSKQIELELLTSFQAPVEPGKFDLVYQNPDGSERVEYAVDRGSLVTERWDSLLEPRLII